MIQPLGRETPGITLSPLASSCNQKKCARAVGSGGRQIEQKILFSLSLSLSSFASSLSSLAALPTYVSLLLALSLYLFPPRSFFLYFLPPATPLGARGKPKRKHPSGGRASCWGTGAGENTLRKWSRAAMKP